MRRTSLVAIVALLLLTIAGGGIAAAHGGSGSGSGGGDSKPIELRVRASKAEQGETLRVRAKVRRADHDSAIAAQAVIHFASGDVTVDLVRKGHSRELKVRVPVLADEALGPVAVDVTVTVDGVVLPMVTVTGEVVVPDDDSLS